MFPKPDSRVTRFYAGKTILVTGGTGQVGKALIEKLLYSMPFVSRIYVLVREKRGSNGSERIEQLIKSPIFVGPNRVSRNILKEKIVPLYGDLTKPGLGLSDQHRSLIADKVNLVFHSAASVRFNSPLKVALQSNFVGTKSIADLCYDIKNLDSFLHVSTCFCQSHLNQVEEKVYPAKMTGPQVMEMASSMTDGQLDRYAREHLYEVRQNSYTFSKAVGENYVSDTCKGLPAAIVRLPGVAPPLREPEPFFSDTTSAYNYVPFAAGLGMARSFRYDPKCPVHVMPIDHVVNGMILIGQHLAVTRPTEVEVYNVELGADSKFSLGALMRNSYTAVQGALSYHRKRPVPDLTQPPSILGHAYKIYILEKFYAFLVDLMSIARFTKPRAYAEISRVTDVRESLEPFFLKSATFKVDNYKKLSDLQEPKDRDMFNTRIEDVARVFNDEKASVDYISNCVTSYMKYKLNETVTPESVADRKKYMRMLKYKEAASWTIIHAILAAMAYSTYCLLLIAINML